MWEDGKEYVCQVHVGFEVSFKLVCPSPSPSPSPSQHHQSFRQNRRPEYSLFLLKLVICSLGCEDELQLAYIYIHFIVFCLFVSVLVFLLLFFMTLFICALPLQYKYSMVQHVMKENSCDSSP